MLDEQYLSVSALHKYLHRKFVNDPYLKRVFVVGEASNVSYKFNQLYFNLKDDQALIRVVRFSKETLPFTIEDGQKLLVVGYVTTYGKGSQYQINLEQVELAGVGALYEQLKKLEEKLRQEGLFNLPKRNIPKFPKRIAVLTSPTGAVIHDIQSTILKRFPVVAIDLYPTVVQGKDAVSSILTNLERVKHSNVPYDTIIIGRGGGSIEDLWAFNDEKVVRTVSACDTPIISCVGHETDTTLIDYVSDYRAETPTAAAVKATPVLTDIYEKLARLQQQLLLQTTTLIRQSRKRLENLKGSYIFVQPERLYEPFYQKLNDLQERLQQSALRQLDYYDTRLDKIIQAYIHINPLIMTDKYNTTLEALTKQLKVTMEKLTLTKSHELDKQIEKLSVLSPLNSLKRGYSIVAGDDRVITQAKDVSVGQTITIEISDATLIAEINSIEKKERLYGN